MIEYRATLWKDKKFEGGFKLDRGTIIYVRETELGWLGMFYEEKGSGHGFALEEDDFRIWSSSDLGTNELVVIPDPPEPAEDIRERQERERRRIESMVRRHREEADRLEQLLGEKGRGAMIVIDIGCARYGGDYSIERLIEEFRPTMLYGFDPNGELVVSAPRDAERVNESRWLMPDGSGIVLEQKAAWTYDGEIGYRSDGLNSWVTDRDDAPRVECFDLARFIWEIHERAPDEKIVLKIDAEGAEYDLLKHLMIKGADEFLHRAIVEWHGNDPSRRVIEKEFAVEIEEWRW